MTLAGHLQTILEEIQISEDDRVAYTAAAEKIRNKLMEDLKKVDINFREAFSGLSLTGSYLDRVKLYQPDEFDLHMKLNFPFEVTPKRDKKRPGFLFLYAPGGLDHPAVVNGYISRVALQTWLRNGFEKVFQSYTSMTIDGELFELDYLMKGYGCAHTIEATSKSKSISFDFVPVLEFDSDEWPSLSSSAVRREVKKSWSWFSVPQYSGTADERTFMVCAPHWEREMMKDMNNLKNIVRLMKAMRDAHKQDFPQLSSYMLKTVVLLRMHNLSTAQDLGTLFIFMWRGLMRHFRKHKLSFYLATEYNLFDRINRVNFVKCSDKGENLWSKINNLGKEPKYETVARLFLK